MSELLPSEESKGYKLEVIQASLEIAPGEFDELKSEIDRIREISKRERDIYDEIKKLDEMDGSSRIDSFSSVFYDPHLNEHARFYLLAPFTTSFPEFTATLKTEAGAFTTRLSVNPICIDSSQVIAESTEVYPRTEEKVGYAMLFDYTQPLQPVELRVLTSSGDHPAYVYGEELWGELFEKLEASFPKAEEEPQVA